MNTVSMNNTIKIYTDGSCLGNGKEGMNNHGGWAAIVIRNDNEQHQRSGHAPHTTNNQMELQAVIEGLKMIFPTEDTIIIHSDSTYVVNGLNSWMTGWKKRGWRKADKKPVQNLEQWKELDSLKDFYPNLQAQWVRGHSGDPMNELADSLAVDASNGTEVDKTVSQ